MAITGGLREGIGSGRNLYQILHLLNDGELYPECA